MKRILATLALLLGALHILSAVPAYPGKIRVTQPDGSVIMIQIHGDEWYHYVTDERGRVVAQDADGFYRPAEKPSPVQLAQAAEMRKAAQQMRAQAQAQSLSLGEHRIPVVLVAFSDTPFTIDDPRSAFDALLNQEGYSAHGATGSVRDFYVENSHGAYSPQFDVYGPVTLSKASSSYVNSASEALREACNQLNSQIDFTRYDSDSDGSVDMILMYYAGHNQAEGGGSDTIWPHQGYASGRYDGKNLSRYFCTSELRGASGSAMCGIGTTTHEFAHSLGLPDFYDTDYETNGEAGGLYSYSTMCSGPYNNSGRTPPYFNSEERRMLGWMGDQTEISRQGSLSIGPVQDGIAYKTPTSTAGEYFVYECRNKSGWDSALPGAGLLVYHVDKSQRQVTIIQTGWSGQEIESTYTAAELWNNWVYTNAINENGSHPCFYLVPAASQQSMNYGYEYNIPFPGNRRITQYTPVDWEGVQSDFKFTGISHSGDKVSVTVTYTTTPGIEGRVLNTSAKPVRGATVSLYAGTTQEKTATTGADGSYSFKGTDLADGTFTLTASCSGYVEASTEVTVGRKIETQDFFLRKEGESTETVFSRYDPASSVEPFGSAGLTDIAAAILVTSDETMPFGGKQMKTISFQPAGSSASSVTGAYVFVESGGKRQFTQKVDNVRFGVLNTVSVVGQEYYIPAGTPVYVGYGLVGCSESEPVMVQECTSEAMGYYGTFNGTRAVSWKEMNVSGKTYTPAISAVVGEPVQPELGFNHIANPGNGTYKAGDRFDLALVLYEDDTPSSVSWTFDGQAVQAGPVTLTAGTHAVEAHLTYSDGSAEVIRLAVTAK